jgi:hypothetical protein
VVQNHVTPAHISAIHSVGARPRAMTPAPALAHDTQM